MSIIPIRVFFQKTDRLKYISHLDLMNVFSRAITRSKLPVWYTEGFNQRIYISFPFPLSLGYEGLKESFEFRLTQPVEFSQVREKLNRVLPPELAVSQVGSPQIAFTQVDSAQYKVSLLYPKTSREELKELEAQLQTFLDQTELLVEKKSKKRTTHINIAPSLKLLSTEVEPEHLTSSLCLSAGIHFNINPRLVVEAFEEQTGKKAHHTFVTREEFFTKEGSIYQ